MGNIAGSLEPSRLHLFVEARAVLPQVSGNTGFQSPGFRKLGLCVESIAVLEPQDYFQECNGAHRRLTLGHATQVLKQLVDRPSQPLAFGGASGGR